MISPELSLMWLQLAITLQSKKLYCVSIKWTNLLNYICKVALKFPLKNIYKMLRMNIISALKQVEIYYHLYLHQRFIFIVYMLHILTQMFSFGFSWLLQYPCLLAACRMVSAWPTHHQQSHPCSLRMLRLHWPLNLVQIWMKCWHILHGWVSFPENLELSVNIYINYVVMMHQHQ